MTEMKDPVRLQLGGSPDAQSLLRSARGDAPTQAQLDRLAGKLAPVVSATAPAASLTVWLLGGVAVIGTVAALLWMRDRDTDRASVARPAVVAPVVAPVTAPRETPAPPPAPPPAVVEETPSTKPATEAPRPSKRKPAPPVVVAPAVQPTEMELLGPAHAALRDGDAARALALATRHADLYATGVMSEEREAIAIESLQRLGRDEARIRFGKFVERFPRSGYRARLERLVTEMKR
jgi:hypothetical protein